MGLIDKLSAGAERAAKEAEKAFDKGKAKVGELQVEMQMDSAAKKLGYLVFDFYRGRQVDQAERQRLLDDLSRMEDQLFQARAEAAAKAGGPTGPTGPAGPSGPGGPAPSSSTGAPDGSPGPEAAQSEQPGSWPQDDA